MAVLELPTDRPYPQGGLSSSGNSAIVELPSDTAAALRRLTTACNTTLYTTVLTAWKVGALSGLDMTRQRDAMRILYGCVWHCLRCLPTLPCFC